MPEHHRPALTEPLGEQQDCKEGQVLEHSSSRLADPGCARPERQRWRGCALPTAPLAALSVGETRQKRSLALMHIDSASVLWGHRGYCCSRKVGWIAGTEAEQASRQLLSSCIRQVLWPALCLSKPALGSQCWLQHHARWPRLSRQQSALEVLASHREAHRVGRIHKVQRYG